MKFNQFQKKYKYVHKPVKCSNSKKIKSKYKIGKEINKYRNVVSKEKGNDVVVVVGWAALASKRGKVRHYKSTFFYILIMTLIKHYRFIDKKNSMC